MKHTKEPWRMYQEPSSLIVTEESPDLLCSICSTFNTSLSTEQMNANAERIVACINACRGITNEALHKGLVKCAVQNLAENLPYEDGNFYFDDEKVWGD